MSARGLRLLISVMLVFGIFVYILSTQMNALVPVKSADEGLLGGPVPGLTKWQLEKFKEGKELFVKNFSPQEGLGPLYNGSSCVQCHSEPMMKALDPAKLLSKDDASGKAVVASGASKNMGLSSDTKSGAIAEVGKAEESKSKAESDTSKSLKSTEKNAGESKAGAKDAVKNSDTLSVKSKGENVDSQIKSSAKEGSKASKGSEKDKVKGDGRLKGVDKKPAVTAGGGDLPSPVLSMEPSFPELAQQTVYLVAKRDEKGRYASEPISSLLSKAELKDLERMIRKGGPILVRKSISEEKLVAVPADCKIDSAKKLPEGTEFLSKRVAHQLYGLGLVDSVADGAINYNAARQRMLKNGPHGRAVGLQRTYYVNPTFGRFGSKAQFSSVMNCVGNEMGVNLGLSNPLFPHTLSLAGLDAEPPCFKTLAASPNDKGATLLKINFYLLTLSPPPRGPRNQQVEKGERLFSKMGCAVCHLPEMRTPEKVMVMNPDGDVEQGFAGLREAPPFISSEQNRFGISAEPKCIELRALEKKVFYPYSDFLVHDMGAALADGVAQNGTTGGEWKTAALWGLRHRKVYLHDGRARTLNAAIQAHGGDGKHASDEFAKLTDSEKESLTAFLQSL